MYARLIDRLLSVNQGYGIKLGLDNCLRLDRLLGYPSKAFRSIHIAGTNGKGSVSIKTASALQNAGHRVGLFTSPHLSSFRERIRIDGELISESSVEAILPRLLALIEREQIPATFFEVTTFLAFQYFAESKVDVAVLEVGLGGCLDSTNIVLPELSVITSISLDHTELLGGTLEAIAYEKAGIIKPNVPVVIGPRVPRKPVAAVAEAMNAPVVAVEGSFIDFEVENRAVAQAALQLLAPKFSLDGASISNGLEASLPCRFEVLEGEGYESIVLDVAHNPDGLKHLFSRIAQRFSDKELRLVLGLSKSKDVAGCLAVVKEHAAYVHTVHGNNGRNIAAEELSQQLISLGFSSSCVQHHPAINEGLVAARAGAREQNQILVVCGSFFIMSEVRRSLGIVEPIDRIDMNERV